MIIIRRKTVKQDSHFPDAALNRNISEYFTKHDEFSGTLRQRNIANRNIFQNHLAAAGIRKYLVRGQMLHGKVAESALDMHTLKIHAV